MKGILEIIAECTPVTYSPITLKDLNDYFKLINKERPETEYIERITVDYLLSMPDWMFCEWIKHDKFKEITIIGGTDQFKAIEEIKLKLTGNESK